VSSRVPGSRSYSIGFAKPSLTARSRASARRSNGWVDTSHRAPHRIESNQLLHEGNPCVGKSRLIGCSRFDPMVIPRLIHSVGSLKSPPHRASCRETTLPKESFMARAKEPMKRALRKSVSPAPREPGEAIAKKPVKRVLRKGAKKPDPFT